MKKLIHFNSLFLWAAILPIALTLLSCSAHSPRTLSENYQTIHIPTVKNETTETGLGEKLTHGMITAFQRDGRLRVVGKSAADIELRTRISKVDVFPFAYTDIDRAVGYNMNIEILVDALDTASGEPIFKDRPFSNTGVFILSNEISDSRGRDVVASLSEAVLSALLEDW